MKDFKAKISTKKKIYIQTEFLLLSITKFFNDQQKSKKKKKRKMST